MIGAVCFESISSKLHMRESWDPMKCLQRKLTLSKTRQLLKTHLSLLQAAHEQPVSKCQFVADVLTQQFCKPLRWSRPEGMGMLQGLSLSKATALTVFNSDRVRWLGEEGGQRGDGQGGGWDQCNSSFSGLDCLLHAGSKGLPAGTVALI